jgi:hypothetical protein
MNAFIPATSTDTTKVPASKLVSGMAICNGYSSDMIVTAIEPEGMEEYDGWSGSLTRVHYTIDGRSYSDVRGEDPAWALLPVRTASIPPVADHRKCEHRKVITWDHLQDCPVFLEGMVTEFCTCWASDANCRELKAIEPVADHSATIQGMAETIVRLSIEQQEAFGAVKDTRVSVATAKRELHKFETRALKCKTLRGQSNNRALAEYQRGIVTSGEKRLVDLQDEIQHNASEVIRFNTMIAELRRGLTRRSALCDGLCTDEMTCVACTAHEAADVRIMADWEREIPDDAPVLMSGEDTTPDGFEWRTVNEKTGEMQMFRSSLTLY